MQLVPNACLSSYKVSFAVYSFFPSRLSPALNSPLTCFTPTFPRLNQPTNSFANHSLNVCLLLFFYSFCHYLSACSVHGGTGRAALLHSLSLSCCCCCSQAFFNAYTTAIWTQLLLQRGVLINILTIIKLFINQNENVQQTTQTAKHLTWIVQQKQKKNWSFFHHFFKTKKKK